MLKRTLTATIVATAGLVAVASPGASAMDLKGASEALTQRTSQNKPEAKTGKKRLIDLKGASDSLTQH